MLVLSRRISETIRIGSDIEIRVLKLRMPDGRILRTKGRIEVVLGIQAPQGLKILREEVQNESSNSDQLP